MRNAKKTERRVALIEAITAALSDDYLFSTLDYRRRSEAALKQAMHRPLLAAVRALEPKAVVKWEGDVNTTVNHVHLFGVRHRPDFVVETGKERIAVEVKRGEKGGCVREGIGQGVVYSSSDFDFVVYLFIDTTKEKLILGASDDPREQKLLNEMWETHNVRMTIV